MTQKALSSARRTSRLHVIVLSPDLANFMHTSKVDFRISSPKVCLRQIIRLSASLASFSLNIFDLDSLSVSLLETIPIVYIDGKTYVVINLCSLHRRE